MRKFTTLILGAAFVALVLTGTAWFLYNLSLESISDFASYKNILFAGFAGVGIGTCIFVQDFLAVRGLAVVLGDGRQHAPRADLQRRPHGRRPQRARNDSGERVPRHGTRGAGEAAAHA